MGQSHVYVYVIRDKVDLSKLSFIEPSCSEGKRVVSFSEQSLKCSKLADDSAFLCNRRANNHKTGI